LVVPHDLAAFTRQPLLDALWDVSWSARYEMIRRARQRIEVATV
jgi:hypothetical protein